MHIWNSSGILKMTSSISMICFMAWNIHRKCTERCEACLHQLVNTYMSTTEMSSCNQLYTCLLPFCPTLIVQHSWYI